jgi:DNA-binding beta-propeller fold protein YncE
MGYRISRSLIVAAGATATQVAAIVMLAACSLAASRGVTGQAARPPNATGDWFVLAGARTGAGQFSRPAGVAVDAAGNVFVADTGNHRIQKLSPEGQVLALWGSEGPAPGQFSSPMGLAIDADGNLLVADAGNHRIQQFSADGEPLAQWGSEGTP